jgi:hypothetical protein
MLSKKDSFRDFFRGAQKARKMGETSFRSTARSLLFIGNNGNVVKFIQFPRPFFRGKLSACGKIKYIN